MYGECMTIINYDDYIMEKYFDKSKTTGNTLNMIYSIRCSYCNKYIINYQWFYYCPFCGKQLFIKENKKTVLEHVNKILDEIKEIKKKMESEK